MKCRTIVAVAIAAASLVTTSAAVEKTLHSFNPEPGGNFPQALITDGAGNIYGTASGGLYESGVLYRFSQDSKGHWGQTVLYNFKGGSEGFAPYGLAQDNAGNLYGIARGGGTGTCGGGGCGQAVKLSPNSKGVWTLTSLFSFQSTSDGEYPTGVIAIDRNGNLYGTTSNYGDTGYGVVFQLAPSANGTWTETILATLSGGTEGAFLYALVLDQSGNVFGTTETGGSGSCGSFGCGTVFELSLSSGGNWTYAVVYSFLGGNDGQSPLALTFDSAGHLFGSAAFGGSASGCSASGGCGTVFQLTPTQNGQWTETTLYTFGNPQTPPQGVGPSGVSIDAQGNLYGTTYSGGTGTRCAFGCGAVFEVSPNGNGQWSGKILYNFLGGNDGYNPGAGVVLVANQPYGTTILGGATGWNGTFFGLSINHNNWHLTTLFDFPFTDGNAPYAGLIADSSGNLYGTTENGGSVNFGAVYQMSPKAGGGWTESLIYSFDLGFFNGVGPSALTLDAKGNLYGTTALGGVPEFGTVFEVSPSTGGWTGSTIYTFSGGVDGERPSVQSGLVFDHLGNLYGTTTFGGTRNRGTVFELSPSGNGQWTKIVLYNFAGFPNDGGNPGGGLTMDSSGNLYGTTQTGGSSAQCKTGCGTVFELSPANGGWRETILYSLQGGTTDGANPLSTLVFDGSGNLFGTTFQGGINAKCLVLNGPRTCGVVFELSPTAHGWTETVLHKFSNSHGDGASPSAGLTFDGSGNLYGTTSAGGSKGYGTIYKLTSGIGSWSYSVVYSFGNGYDGRDPWAGLFFDGAGRFYGTTASGGYGANGFDNTNYGGYGTVFEFTP